MDYFGGIFSWVTPGLWHVSSLVCYALIVYTVLGCLQARDVYGVKTSSETSIIITLECEIYCDLETSEWPQITLFSSSVMSVV